jgi:hypothetical protein
MEAKVKFVAVDMPEATPFMLHIYAARPRCARRVIDLPPVEIAASGCR